MWRPDVKMWFINVAYVVFVLSWQLFDFKMAFSYNFKQAAFLRLFVQFTWNLAQDHRD